MKALFIKLGTFLRYSAGGLLSTLADNLVFYILAKIGCSNTLSLAAARVVSVTLNYLLLRFAVFSQDSSQKKGAFFRYILLVIFSTSIVWCALHFLTPLVPRHPIYVKIPVELVMFFFNYLMSGKFVFGKKQEQEAADGE